MEEWHPDYMGDLEYTLDHLTDTDHRMWSLGTYARCLEDWDCMNSALRQAQKELAEDYGSIKHTFRYRGLLLLREVDNGVS